MKTQIKKERRVRRKQRIRAQVAGTATRPRLAVFRSNRAVYAQLIDDVAGITLAQADSRKESGARATERAEAVGAKLAKMAQAKKITNAVFDRGGFPYVGAVRAVAEGARKGGLTL